MTADLSTSERRRTRDRSSGRESPSSWHDEVVLLDERGRPSGRATKSAIHGPDTPLHLAFSCHVVRADGLVLITRRAATKRTWPGWWSNACCGHPRPGEALDTAVRRHLHDELGLTPRALGLALADFTYRATMPDGCSEHELCPVFVAEVDGAPELDPDEADAYEWMAWTDLRRRAHDRDDLSPWSRTQIERLALVTDHPLGWVRARAGRDAPRPARTLRAEPAHRDVFAATAGEVDAVLTEFVDGESAVAHGIEPLTSEVVGAIRTLLAAGGKRLRPCLVVCGAEAGPGRASSRDHRRDVLHLAAAVEMLHTFALLHDDVMDRSATRRGRPTAQVHLADLHRAAGGKGDSEWFGATAALLAGDLAFVWADELLDRLGCTGATTARVRSVFTTLRREVIAGQYLDLRLAGPSATDRQAQTVALLKSARYTVTRPLELGAVLTGAADVTIDALRQFGDAVGVAFQLRDDVLGVFGDPAVTGKGAVEDLHGGKASLLLVRALELCRPVERQQLCELLGRADLDAADVDTCRAIVAGSGALASVEALIDAKVQQAGEALDRIHPDVAARLESLAALLVDRHA